jgi:acyl transferase domain-containing protein
MTFDASASKKQTSENVASSANSCTPIAIVGIGFRGPGDAKNVDKLWEMILAGREAWSRVPTRRWNNEAFYHPDNSRHGAVS